MSWNGRKAETIAAIRGMEYVCSDALAIITGFSSQQITRWRKAGLLSHIEGKSVRYRLATVLSEIAELQVRYVETPKDKGGEE